MVDERYSSVDELSQILASLWVAEVVRGESRATFSTAEEVDGIVQTLDRMDCQNRRFSLGLQHLRSSCGQVQYNSIGLFKNNFDTGITLPELLDLVRNLSLRFPLLISIHLRSGLQFPALLDSSLKEFLLDELIHQHQIRRIRTAASERKSRCHKLSRREVDVCRSVDDAEDSAARRRC